jgi:hypothetical protein
MTSQAATLRSVNGPWNIDALVADKRAGHTVRDIAFLHGRTLEATKQKLNALRRSGDLEPANDDQTPRLSGDARHVAAVMAQGGFPAVVKAPSPRWRNPATEYEKHLTGDINHAKAAALAGGFPVANHPRTGLPLLTYPTR